MRTSLCCLIFFSVVSIIIGICLICTSIWALADPNTSLYSARVLTAGRSDVTGLMISLISPLIFGVVTFVPFALLMYGIFALEVEWRSLLVAHTLILLIMIVIELPIAILPMAFLQYHTTTALQSGLTSALNVEYRGLPYSYTQGNTISLEWERLMIRESCCGVNGVNDFTSSYGLYASTWYTAFRTYTLTNGTIYTQGSVQIPMSCCILRSKLILTTQDWLNMRTYLNNELCPLITSYGAHSQGCYSKVYTYVTTYSIAIVCVSSFLILCELLAFSFSTYLLCKAMDDKEIWRDYYDRSRVAPSVKVNHRTYNSDPLYNRTGTAR